MVDSWPDVDHFGVADRLSQRVESQFGKVFPDFLGDEPEEGLEVFGVPEYRLRSSGFWVAIPAGQVSRWQTRIITQPDTTSGAVANPNSSAPSNAATTTSRPVFRLPIDLNDHPIPQP